KVTDFLKARKFDPTEIAPGAISTTVQHARDWRGHETTTVSSYTLTRSIIVTTSHVEAIAAPASDVTELLQDGIDVVSDSPMCTLSDPYAALRVRDYRFYLASSLIGTIGYQILMPALGYDLYNKTNSYMSLGWLGLFTTIPVFVFTLPAGQLADSFNRKRMII